MRSLSGALRHGLARVTRRLRLRTVADPSAHCVHLRGAHGAQRRRVPRLREEEIDMVAHLRDDKALHRGRNVLEDAAALPRVELAIGEDEVGCRLECFPASIVDGGPVRSRLDLPAAAAARHHVGQNKRLRVKHIRDSVARGGLQHVGAVEVVPQLAVARGLVVARLRQLEAAARGGGAARVVVEDANALAERREQRGYVRRARGRLVRCAEEAAHLAQRVGRQNPAAVEHVRRGVRIRPHRHEVHGGLQPPREAQDVLLRA
mmetsp:Transcript_25307/g.64336  ORF Transcript_25307/g.64336 Transcript_25307/m.64336 type:complete len:262 (+) Transcript_25307:103-888(+)